jgi:hypothetical protein
VGRPKRLDVRVGLRSGQREIVEILERGVLRIRCDCGTLSKLIYSSFIKHPRCFRCRHKERLLLANEQRGSGEWIASRIRETSCSEPTLSQSRGPCHIWLGASRGSTYKNKSGGISSSLYGYMQDETGRQLSVVRYLYQKKTGELLARNDVFLNLCGNTLCVNLAHWELSSRSQLPRPRG